MIYKRKPKEGDLKTDTEADDVFEHEYINGDWRLIYHKGSYGYESWLDYDEDGNEIHYKNNRNGEFWLDYDRNKITKDEFERLWELK